MDAGSLLIGVLIGAAAGLAVGLALARGRVAAAQANARAAADKATYLEDGLAERFRALSNQALDATNERFMEIATGQIRAAGVAASGDLERRQQAIETLVGPLRETLGRMEQQLKEADTARQVTQAELTGQLEVARRDAAALRAETRSLVSALRRPEARGRWGELQLRRVAELAGMMAHCDFDEQVSVPTADGVQRPDMVVRLSGDRQVIVDSKVSLSAYLEAAESDDPAAADARLDAHAKHLRQHVDRLAAKSYWTAFRQTPEFVVLFIPGEAFLAPALDRDPELLEYAMTRRVHIATPTTLISMLRTAHYAWQQATLGENARAVFELGRQLHDRLGTLSRHVDGVGRALGRAVVAYNQTVGSLESRVLATARKMGELGVGGAEPVAPAPLEDVPRPVSATELLDTAPGDE